tara:strand:- start:1012 stop:2577 length:1566 start_codon:yes stop_codon:yes gene_type:complete
MHIINKLHKYFCDKKIILNFIRNNKKFFPRKKSVNKNKILVEHFNYVSSFISFSYYAEVLSKKYNADIHCYYPTELSFFQKINNHIKVLIGLPNYNIARCLGSKNIIFPKSIMNTKNKKIFRDIMANIRSKKDILKIKILSIPVGDLIYDEYLYKFKKLTIDVNDKEFINFLSYSVGLFMYWYEYLNDKKIKSLIISHTCYYISLPGRIAAFKKIPCYCVNNVSSFYITKNDYLTYTDFSSFPKIFKKIPKKISNQYIRIAKKEVLKKFINKDNLNFDHYRKKKNNKPISLLVSAHCFTDAVHIHGKNRIFSDHYEWINFLGQISNKTNYEWSIKIHPNHYDRNLDKMNSLITKYSRFKLLPKETKNINLLKKIDYVLTVYGTVSREYPLFNIPVLNCSHDGPYSAYKFSENFSRLKDYKKALFNLERIKVNKNVVSKIYEQFSVKYLLHYYFFGQKKQAYFTDQLKNHKMDPINYIDHWNKMIDKKQHLMHLEQVKKFIESKRHHFHADNTSKFSKFLNI